MKKSRRSRSCWEIFGHFLSFDPGVNWCVGLSHGRSGKSPVSWVLLSPSFQHSRQGEKQCKEPSFLVGSANIKSFLAPLPKQGLVSLYLSRHTAKSVLLSLPLSIWQYPIGESGRGKKDIIGVIKAEQPGTSDLVRIFTEKYEEVWWINYLYFLFPVVPLQGYDPVWCLVQIDGESVSLAQEGRDATLQSVFLASHKVDLKWNRCSTWNLGEKVRYQIFYTKEGI